MKKLTAAEWAKTAGLTKDDIATQIKAFYSEVVEYELSYNQVDRLDAVCDVRFVMEVCESLGYVSSVMKTIYNRIEFEAGFDSSTLTLAYQEVINSNFSKFCTTEDDAKMSVYTYFEQGVTSSHRKEGEWYVIFSNKDQDDKPKGKILKGIYYFEPELEEILL